MYSEVVTVVCQENCEIIAKAQKSNHRKKKVAKFSFATLNNRFKNPSPLR